MAVCEIHCIQNGQIRISQRSLTIITFHARNMNERHYSKQKELGWFFVLWFLQLKQIIIHIFESKKKTLAKFKITMVLTSTTEKNSTTPY